MGVVMGRATGVTTEIRIRTIHYYSPLIYTPLPNNVPIYNVYDKPWLCHGIFCVYMVYAKVYLAPLDIPWHATST